MKVVPFHLALLLLSCGFPAKTHASTRFNSAAGSSKNVGAIVPTRGGATKKKVRSLFGLKVPDFNSKNKTVKTESTVIVEGGMGNENVQEDALYRKALVKTVLTVISAGTFFEDE